MASSTPTVRISAQELRKKFNSGNYWQRMLQGEFTEIVVKISKQVKHPQILEKYPGAESVSTKYFDIEGRLVAVTHYYRDRDGKILGGRKPDPKRLIEDGIAYLADAE